MFFAPVNAQVLPLADYLKGENVYFFVIINSKHILALFDKGRFAFSN